MIYICADDYGLCDVASEHISKCVSEGALNKISVFPNFGKPDMKKLSGFSDAAISLHLNLVEGRALSDRKDVSLLVDADGYFRHTFTGLMVLSVTKRSEFEKQVYTELRAQLAVWRKMVGDKPVMLDSHQHTHMIPGVFRVLMRVLKEERTELKYIRIPSEPLMPYLMVPSLYATYSPVNLAKQWLLKFFGLINKREYPPGGLPTAYFFGILFSGKMDEKRVRRILPHYIRKAEKNGADIEVLFHPGYLSATDDLPKECNSKFGKFYFSSGRYVEFTTVMNLK